MSNEKTTDRATPRPWAVCDDRPDGELCIVTGDEHRLPIAMVDTQNTGDAQAAADAVLIVRAVNAHDALVEALENIVDAACLEPDELAKLGEDDIIEILITAGALVDIIKHLALARGN